MPIDPAPNCAAWIETRWFGNDSGGQGCPPYGIVPAETSSILQMLGTEAAILRLLSRNENGVAAADFLAASALLKADSLWESMI